jgi:hypothetical protein
MSYQCAGWRVLLLISVILVMPGWPGSPGALLHAQEMPWAWVQSPTGDATARGVAVDQAGHVYLAGSFEDELTIGAFNLVSAGTSDIFVLKLAADGELLWAKSFGAEWLEYCRKVTVDVDGNVYVAAQFTSNSLTIGSFVLTNSYQAGHIQWSTFDLVIFKLDGDGEVLWAASGGGLYNESVGDLDADTSGNALLFGRFFSPTVSFGPHTVVNTGNADLCVVKYAAGGTPLWARGAVGDGQDDTWALATDGTDHIYVGGAFRSTHLVFDQFSLPNTSDSFDLYLAKLAPDGAAVWAKTAAGEEWDEVSALAVDVDDHVYATGHFSSDSLRIDTEVLYLSPSSSSNIDMYVARLDPDGTIEWITSSTGGAWLYPNALCAHQGRDLAIVGTFNGLSGGHPESLGTTLLQPIDSYDFFSVQYDAGGDVLWSEAIGGEDMEFGQDVASDALGNLYLTGWSDSDSLRIGEWWLVNAFYNKSFVGRKSREASGLGPTATPAPPPPVGALAAVPNPAAGEVVISFDLEAGGDRELSIYDIAGRLVRRLEGGDAPRGRHRTIWDVRDEAGSRVAAGIYLLRLRGGERTLTRKVVVID